MKIPIGDHSFKVRDGHQVYVNDYGMDDDTVRVQFLNCGLTASIDMTIDDLQRFRDLISGAIADAFKVQPAIQCPACGYTLSDAVLHLDHRTCRRYPFFPGEKGKSEAIDR